MTYVFGKLSCWQGERQFQLNEISLAEEVVVDDNVLNIYIPISFDAVAVFGKLAKWFGPDDSIDVYANYDRDAGEVSEYLEILIKYLDGVEDTAMYHLSPEEKEMFQQKMNEYCMATMEQSLEAMCQKYQQNIVQAM